MPDKIKLYDLFKVMDRGFVLAGEVIDTEINIGDSIEINDGITVH